MPEQQNAGTTKRQKTESDKIQEEAERRVTYDSSGCAEFDGQ